MDGVSKQPPMRDRAYLDSVRDRVLAEIRARPSMRPYLTELFEQPKREVSDEERQRRRARARSQQRFYSRPAARDAAAAGAPGLGA